MTDDVETFYVDDLKVRIVHDPYPSDPRENDNLGTMVCWHRRYNLGDKHGYSEPSEFREDMKGVPHVILPLYLYDHGAITMRTSRFSCPWDSGQVGWIYITHEKIRKEYGWKKLTKSRLAKIATYLEGEVDEYDTYLTGQVYGYIITGREDPDEDDDSEELDSLWGLFGLDYAKEEATAECRRIIAARTQRKAAREAEEKAIAEQAQAAYAATVNSPA